MSRSSSLLLLLLLLTQGTLQASSPKLSFQLPTDSLKKNDSILHDTSSIDPLRFGLFSGVSLGGFILVHAVLNDLWWKGERSAFHFTWEEDWHYALGADKVGHAITPYIATDLYRQGLEWTGISSTGSLWGSAGVVWLYTTYVEVRDGFSKEWGFSWGDFVANNIGIGWRCAEYYYPWLENVRWKMSYQASDAFKSGLYGSIVDDYESTYHWGSLNPEVVLPEAWRDAWPDWLNIAVGHSVKGIASYDGSGNHELYLSLDLDTQGLPGEGSFWKWLKRTLNYYHFPAPAVRLFPEVTWFGIKF